MTGANSRICPSCKGTGQWTLGGEQPDMTPEDASLTRRYAAAAKDGDPDATGRLMSMVGPELATKIVSGESFSAAEFRRGYIRACRASQSAAPGQEPRVPVATHVIRPDDFRRGPLGTHQERPAPASAWPGSGGQRDHYGPGPGITPDHGSAPYPLPGLAASGWTGGW